MSKSVSTRTAGAARDLGPAASAVGARNIYAVLRARRSARTEAVVLQVPLRPPAPKLPSGQRAGAGTTSARANVQPDTFASIALLLGLAKSFRGAAACLSLECRCYSLATGYNEKCAHKKVKCSTNCYPNVRRTQLLVARHHIFGEYVGSDRPAGLPGRVSRRPKLSLYAYCTI